MAIGVAGLGASAGVGANKAMLASAIAYLVRAGLVWRRPVSALCREGYADVVACQHGGGFSAWSQAVAEYLAVLEITDPPLWAERRALLKAVVARNATSQVIASGPHVLRGFSERAN